MTAPGARCLEVGQCRSSWGIVIVSLPRWVIEPTVATLVYSAGSAKGGRACAFRPCGIVHASGCLHRASTASISGSGHPSRAAWCLKSNGSTVAVTERDEVQCDALGPGTMQTSPLGRHRHRPLRGARTPPDDAVGWCGGDAAARENRADAAQDFWRLIDQSHPADIRLEDRIVAPSIAWGSMAYAEG